MGIASSIDKAQTLSEFHKNVNLTHDELTAWLDTVQSRSVGIVAGTTNVKKTSPRGGESVGHLSGNVFCKFWKRHLIYSVTTIIIT